MAIVGVSTSADNFEQISARNDKKLCQVAGEARKIIAPGATTRSFTKAESGALCLFDGVAVAYTLPPITDATDLGMFFDFYTVVTTTSAHSVTCASGEFIGGEIMAASETAGAQDAFLADGTSHVAISTNGTTKGGLIGDQFRLTAITLTQWLVSGHIMTSGTAATPFA